jgi:ABC-type histidine transport system ATPase subunit
MFAVQGNLKVHKASVMIFTAWNLWLQRNRRVFQGVSATPHRILQLIKDDMATRAAARHLRELPLV